MSVMNNTRRRRDFLFLMLLAELACDVLKERKYALILANGPYIFFEALLAQYRKAVPSEAEREKERIAAMKVVNRIVSLDYHSWRAPMKLWFASQVIYRLVASGWRIPNGEHQIEFVASMFKIAEGFTPVPPPTPGKLELVMTAPEKLRALGMFQS